MKEEIKQLIKNRIDYLENNKNHLIIDGDTHPSDVDALDPEIRGPYQSTPNYYQGRPISAPDLVREMDLAGVDACTSWHNPSSIQYEAVNEINYLRPSPANRVNYKKLHASNKYVFESSKTYPERILPAGWTDPLALGIEMAEEMARICIEEFGFLIVKMNPAQNEFHLNDPGVLRITKLIAALGGIPAFHFGGDTKYSPASAMEEVADQLGDHPVLAVHMGGGGSHYVDGDPLCQEARELGLRRTNIFYVLSAIRDCHIESNLITYQLAGEPHRQQVACGSDAPYGKMTWNFGGFRSLFNGLLKGEQHTDPRLREHPDLFDEYSVQNYMGRNLANFLIKGYKALLAVRDHRVSDLSAISGNQYPGQS